MSPAERLAARIAKNREIDRRVAEAAPPQKKSPKSSDVAARQKAVRNALDRFQQIKATEGLDAAAEFVRERTRS